MTLARFEIYQGNLMGDWFWRLRAANGRIIADGAEAYSTKANARRAVWRLRDTLRELEPEVEIRDMDA